MYILTLSSNYHGSAIQESACNAGAAGSIPGSGRFPEMATHSRILAWESHEISTHSRILAWDCHGQNCLAGCSPRGCRELGATELWSTKHFSSHSSPLPFGYGESLSLASFPGWSPISSFMDFYHEFPAYFPITGSISSFVPCCCILKF